MSTSRPISTDVQAAISSRQSSFCDSRNDTKDIHTGDLELQVSLVLQKSWDGFQLENRYKWRPSQQVKNFFKKINRNVGTSDAIYSTTSLHGFQQDRPFGAFLFTRDGNGWRPFLCRPEPNVDHPPARWQLNCRPNQRKARRRWPVVVLSATGIRSSHFFTEWTVSAHFHFELSNDSWIGRICAIRQRCSVKFCTFSAVNDAN